MSDTGQRRGAGAARVWATVSGVLWAAGAAFAGSAARMAPDSFVPVPATSVASLVHQVETNPAVRARYARHFHVPESHIAAYLRANLVVSRLSEAGRYTMFCARPNGLIYPTLMPLPGGSRVFALRSGPAVLTLPEGDPLASYQTAVEERVVATGHTPRAVTIVSPSQQMIAPTQGQEIVVPLPTPTPVYQSVSPLTPAEQGEAAPPASVAAHP